MDPLCTILWMFLITQWKINHLLTLKSIKKKKKKNHLADTWTYAVPFDFKAKLNRKQFFIAEETFHLPAHSLLLNILSAQSAFWHIVPVCLTPMCRIRSSSTDKSRGQKPSSPPKQPEEKRTAINKGNNITEGGGEYLAEFSSNLDWS